MNKKLIPTLFCLYLLATPFIGFAANELPAIQISKEQKQQFIQFFLTGLAITLVGIILAHIVGWYVSYTVRMAIWVPIVIIGLYKFVTPLVDKFLKGEPLTNDFWAGGFLFLFVYTATTFMINKLGIQLKQKVIKNRAMAKLQKEIGIIDVKGEKKFSHKEAVAKNLQEPVAKN